MRIKEIISTILILSVIISVSGCGRKKESYISSEGEDITEAVQEYETCEKSNAKKFTYSDLNISGCSLYDSEDTVIKNIGKPLKTYEDNQSEVRQKIYEYENLTLIFSFIDGTYKLTSADADSGNYIFSRGMKVGDSFDDIINKYYRDQNYKNNYLYSEDKSYVLGNFLYGDNTIDNIDSVNIKDNFEYGVTEYNNPLSDDDSYIVIFTCFEKPYISEFATINDDFAQIFFEIDSKGVINEIRWYYYTEQNT